MKTLVYKAISIGLMMVIIPGALCQTLAADSGIGEDDKPFRLYATALSGAPIASLTAFNDTTINGREINGTQAIWGGEVIRTTKASARLTGEHFGHVTMLATSLAKFSLGESLTPDGDRIKTLIAAVISGGVKVQLQPNTSAYIEAGGLVFQATPGASFRLTMSGEIPTLNIESGKVQTQTTPQRRYTVRPVGMGAKLSVRARSTRQIQVQVTDENDKPVPDLPILFALGQGSGGVLGSGAAAAANVTVTTNAQGLATTSFTAGQSAGGTSISATVPGTNASWTGEIKVNSSSGFLNPTNVAILAAAAAGIIATVVVLANRNQSREPILARPPDVRPK